MGGLKPVQGRIFAKVAGGRSCDVLVTDMAVGGPFKPGKGMRDSPGMGKRDDEGS